MSKNFSILLGALLDRAAASQNNGSQGGDERGIPPEIKDLFDQFGRGAEEGNESEADASSRQIELPIPKATVEIETLVRTIGRSVEFLETLAGVCGLHAEKIAEALPDEEPESLEDLVDGCDVEELLTAFQAALTAVNLLKQQSVGSEELFDDGIACLKEAVTSLGALENYTSDSEVESKTFVLTITGTRADIREFGARYGDACLNLELEAIIACAQQYGHNLAVADCGALEASAEHQNVHAHLPGVDVAAALAQAGVPQDDIEMTSEEPASSAT